MSDELVERCAAWLKERRMPMIVLGFDCNMAESLAAFVQERSAATLDAATERARRAEGERDRSIAEERETAETMLKVEARAEAAEERAGRAEDSLRDQVSLSADLIASKEAAERERDEYRKALDASRAREAALVEAIHDAIVQVHGGADAGDDRHAKVSCGLAFEILADALLEVRP